MNKHLPAGRSPSTLLLLEPYTYLCQWDWKNNITGKIPGLCGMAIFETGRDDMLISLCETGTLRVKLLLLGKSNTHPEVYPLLPEIFLARPKSANFRCVRVAKRILKKGYRIRKEDLLMWFDVSVNYPICMKIL